MLSKMKFAGALLFFLTFSLLSFSQVSPKPAAADTLQEFEIIRAPSMRAIRIDSVTTLQTINGGAIIKQEGTIFHSDSLVLNPTTNEIEAFGNIHINQGDTIHTYGDYLKYLGVEKMAYLKGNVKLTDGKGTLFTKDLDYNLESGIGNFYKGGKVIEKKNVITSLEGTYYSDTKDVYFKKNVEVKGPKDTITADSLLYNMQTKKSNFISQTHIKNAEVDINTTEGSYDLNSGDAFFTRRTTVKDSSGRVYSADNMALEGLSGNGQLEGNAVIIDSANSFVVIANQIFLNKKNNSFLATRKPLLIIQQKSDSTYIAADTIFSGLKGSEMILQKDTVLNINEQQNERVEELIRTDTGNPNNFADSTEDSLTMISDSDLLLRTVNDSLSQIPDSMRHAPDSMRQTPDSMRQTPDSLKHTPDSLKHTPDSIRNTPDSLRQTPDSMRHAPDSIPKDTSRLKIPPPVRDTILPEKEKDSSILKMAEKFRQSKATDSLIISDSIKLTENIKKDTIAPELPADTSLLKLPSDTSGLETGINISERKVQDSTGVTGKPVKDSSATSDSTARFFLAFHNVRIFNDSLQSVCDSLFFSTEDSVFRLYQDPVIWNGESQITGDTIYLFTKNKDPERLYVFENGMMVNRTREGFFNQLAGKTINAYFNEGKIDYARVRGQQSESVHYMQDEDSAYIGMNRATGDVIDFYFRNDELIKVLFINDIKGHMYPMNNIPGEERELRNFKWLDARRPKTKFELFD